MNGLRFKVGELAIVAVTPNRNYVVDLPIRPVYANCDDYQLRKIDPPAEPESMTRHEEIEVPA